MPAKMGRYFWCAIWPIESSPASLLGANYNGRQVNSGQSGELARRIGLGIERGLKLRGFATLAVVALILNGCAANSPGQTSIPRPDPTAQAAASPKEFRLDQLWQSREGPGAASDFLIGTGDVIAVSVPGLSDSQASSPGAATVATESGEQPGDWTAQVNAMGDVILPVLGRIHVAGLTEEQLREELLQRLEKYMYQPQVEVLVRTYNSRQVAISGEVHSPGMYTINKPNETIRNLIMRAGGTTDNAADDNPNPPARHGRRGYQRARTTRRSLTD
jgi:protein involved in polysaccharide export with SLBB domain